MSELNNILNDANEQIAKAQDLHALEQLRSKYLGKKGSLTEILKTLGSLEPEARKRLGHEVNQAKEQVLAALQTRQQQFKDLLLEASLTEEAIDVTLPGRGQRIGSLHPITLTQRRMERFFISMGFTIVEGPEIEDEFHNFTALNFPKNHPARREQDTFYLEHDKLLRTHTSPTQIRAMQTLPLPLRVITPGKVYRCDDPDATHSPMFHQLEGLVIDENVNFANLKWILNKFLTYFFARPVKTKFRPSYFPFTEPSAEVDIYWEKGEQAGWLEMLGCGMVHPNVLKAGGIDSEKYTGFAFGMGIDRFAKLYYGVSDLRSFFENDLQFLEQF